MPGRVGRAGGSYDLDNGILLRRDIHRLFDLNLVAIDPECLEVHIADEVGGDYNQYSGPVGYLPDGGLKTCHFVHRWENVLAERVSYLFGVPSVMKVLNWNTQADRLSVRTPRFERSH